MKKKYLVLLLAVASLNLFGQTNWIKYASNPIITAEPGTWEYPKIIPGSVIFYEGNYHMWYTGGDRISLGGTFLIGHAVSADGISWTKDENNPILTGSDGEWDSAAVWEPSVMLMDTVFHMWYSAVGKSDQGSYSIGHATSVDGINWEKDTNNPVLNIGTGGEWDDSQLYAPSVIYNGNEFHMYYTGHSEEGYFGDLIGHATSPDGISWTKDPNNPVLSPGDDGNWDFDQACYPQVVYTDNTFHMWYAGGWFLDWDIGYASSEDGSSWTKSVANPVLEKGPENFESELLSMNCVLYDSSVYKMWYRGQNAEGGGGIGYATSNPGAAQINYNADDQLRIYPNPTSDHINVYSNLTGKYTLEIHAANGQLVQRKDLSVNDCQFNLAAFPIGVYYITVSAEKIILKEKIIKL
jgi:predicted GH43/DUF377 family glycosyl hydrolase